MITRAEIIESKAVRARVDQLRQMGVIPKVAGRARQPVSSAVNVPNPTYYEALSVSPNRAPVNVMQFGALRMFNGTNWQETLHREALAALGRWIVDNYPVAAFAIGLMADYSAPITPRAQTDDAEWNKDADAYFDIWAKQCEFTGRFDFHTSLTLACTAIDTDGDVGVIMQSVNGVPKLRFLPTWRIGGSWLGSQPGKFDGVLLDDDGVVNGYQVILKINEQVIIPADQMTILYEPERAERYRGLSPIRRGSNDLRDAAEIKTFEKLAQKIQGAFAGVIEGRDPIMDSDWEDSDNPSVGMAGTTTPPSLAVANLFGGEIPVIDGTFKQLGGVRSPANTTDVNDFLAGQFVMGMGFPPAFLLDSRLTGPNTRSVLGKVDKRIKRRQWVLGRFAGWTWTRVIADGIQKGDLAPIDGQFHPAFQKPPLVTIDLGDQERSDQEAVANGLMSRSRYFGNRGMDFYGETDRQVREDLYLIQQLKQLSTDTGVPLPALLERYGIAQQPKQQGNPNGQSS